jgi:hypothetical protein
MTDFKINDLVIIARQPGGNHPNYYISMQGLAGYIEEINGEYAQFVELKENGCGGCGAVPLSHLKLENDNPRLQVLKKAKDDQFFRNLKESQERTKRYNDLKNSAMENACNLTGVSMRSVMLIFDICSEFESKWEESNGY